MVSSIFKFFERVEVNEKMRTRFALRFLVNLELQDDKFLRFLSNFTALYFLLRVPPEDILIRGIQVLSGPTQVEP